MGVEPGGDQHELGGELERGGQDHVLEHGDPQLLIGTSGHRHVDRRLIPDGQVRLIPDGDIGDGVGGATDLAARGL